MRLERQKNKKESTSFWITFLRSQRQRFKLLMKTVIEDTAGKSAVFSHHCSLTICADFNQKQSENGFSLGKTSELFFSYILLFFFHKLSHLLANIKEKTKKGINIWIEDPNPNYKILLIID